METCNEQTPKAVENIFSALMGTQTNPNLIDLHWTGKVQESFSFEIVSLEGFVQFLIRTPAHFRDVVEAAVYSQYPEVEITEVEDYTSEYENLQFPNEQYNLWGTEFILVKDYPYPIKTYSEFEHQATQTFIDPIADLLESLSRLNEGEQCWLQLVVTPLKPPAWGEKAKKVVKTILGQPYAAPVSLVDKIMTAPLNALSGMMAGATGEVKKEEQFKVMNLSPGDRSVLERVQNKISRQAFRVKYRMVYLAKREVFKKSKVVSGVTGALHQLNTSDANGFKPGSRTKTAADYFFTGRRVAKRQRSILHHYCGRENYYGETPSNLLLSNEELATLWHLPVMTVKAHSVEMAANKKAVAPSRLPFASRQNWATKSEKPASRRSEEIELKPAMDSSGALRRAEAPVNLPEADDVTSPKSPVNLPFYEPVVKIKPSSREDVVNPEKDLSFVKAKGNDEKSTERKNPEPPANLPTV
jgi:hypothetical protein